MDWSCSKFKDESGKTYFVSVERHALPGGSGEASVDLAVADGAAAWTAHGVTSAALGGKKTIANKLMHLLAALSELEDATVQYKHEVRLAVDGGMELTVSWLLTSGAKSDVSATLVPAVPAAPVLASMLELLVDNLVAVKATATTALQNMREFEKQASRSQELVDKYVSTKAAQDKEMNAKVAALLNSKKKKLREMQKQNAILQEELEQLRQQGGRGRGAAGSAAAAAAQAAPEPMEEDAEMGGDEASDGGRAGASKDAPRQAGQQQQQQQEEEEEGRERGMAVALEGGGTEDDEMSGDATDNNSLGH